MRSERSSMSSVLVSLSRQLPMSYVEAGPNLRYGINTHETVYSANCKLHFFPVSYKIYLTYDSSDFCPPGKVPESSVNGHLLAKVGLDK